MRRGFKAGAEKRALQIRSDLSVNPTDKICPWRLAESLGVIVLNVAETDLAEQHRTRLLVEDPDSWSGLSLVDDGTHIVVLNETHPRTRQAATLSHELAHIILDHRPSEITASATGLYLLSDYSEDQEAEADWLGAAMLLPQEALLDLRTRGKTFSEIAAMYGVSDELCIWRCRMTGIEKRLSYRRRRKNDKS